MLVPNKEELTIALIKSMGINFPLIREWGCDMYKMLLIVVPSGQLRTMSRLLSACRMPRLNEIMNKNQIISTLTCYGGSYAIYLHNSSKRGRDLLELLISVVRAGEVNGCPITALPIIISEGFPIEISLQDFLVIYFEQVPQMLSFTDTDVVPRDNQLPVVLDKLITNCSSTDCAEEKALLAAACCLYPSLAKSGYSDALEDYLNHARDVVHAAEENQSTMDLEQLFVYELQWWQEQVEFSDVHNVMDLKEEIVAQIDQILIFDDEYIYMKDKIFKEIAKNLLDMIAIDVLKRTLTEAGVICPDQEKTYTAKMGYRDSSGKYCRERMMRFRRSRLNMLGEMDFIETCMERKDRLR